MKPYALLLVLLLAGATIAGDGGCGCEKCDSDRTPRTNILKSKWVNVTEFNDSCWRVCPDEVFTPYWNCTERHMQGSKGEYCWLVKFPTYRPNIEFELCEDWEAYVGDKAVFCIDFNWDEEWKEKIYSEMFSLIEQSLKSFIRIVLS